MVYDGKEQNISFSSVLFRVWNIKTRPSKQPYQQPYHSNNHKSIASPQPTLIKRCQLATTCVNCRRGVSDLAEQLSPSNKELVLMTDHSRFHWTLDLVFCLQYFLFTHIWIDFRVQGQLLFKWKCFGKAIIKPLVYQTVFRIQAISNQWTSIQKTKPNAGS